MPLFIISLVVLLIMLANWLAQRDDATFNLAFDRLLLVSNLPLIFSGLLLALLPTELTDLLREEGGLLLNNFPAAGIVIALMGGWGALVSFLRVRQWLARWLPLKPKSPVHALALMLSAYLVGNTMLTLTQGGLAEMVATAEAANLGDLVLQQALFVVLSLFGVGLLVRRKGQAISTRLGLLPMSGAQIRLGLRWIGILVVLQWVAGAVWAFFAPEESQMVQEISGELFANMNSVWDWFVVALAAGMGEEILFRGALQPVFGLWATSLLFAIAHVQYGITPVMLVVFIIGLALGWIRERTNTSVAIFVHFGYNFILGLLSLLALYVEQFVSNGGM